MPKYAKNCIGNFQQQKITWSKIVLIRSSFPLYFVVYHAFLIDTKNINIGGHLAILKNGQKRHLDHVLPLRSFYKMAKSVHKIYSSCSVTVLPHPSGQCKTPNASLSHSPQTVGPHATFHLPNVNCQLPEIIFSP